jgi:hypothetical protein
MSDMRGRPRNFTILLPPGWVRLQVDDRVEASIARLVSLRLSSLPARQRDAAGHALRRELTDLAQRAAERGGLELYLSVDPVRGQPISAACVVSYLPAGAGEARAESADLLPLIVAPGRDAVTDLTPVAGGMALRYRYRGAMRPEADHSGDLPATHVDYLVEVPGGAAHLLLSFSTVTEPVVEALVTLFEAIAMSLRWVW